MDADLSEAEASRRVDILQSNIEALKAAVHAHSDALGNEATVAERELDDLSEMLPRLVDEHGPIHAYGEGLRRLRRLRTETLSDDAASTLDEAVEGDLSSWE